MRTQGGSDIYLRRLIEGIAVAELSVDELWDRYRKLDGSADAVEVEGYVCGLMTLEAGQHNVLTDAVNERLRELGYRPAVPRRALCCGQEGGCAHPVSCSRRDQTSAHARCTSYCCYVQGG